MRHTYYFEGTAVHYDGEFRCPLVVIGQRNVENFKVKFVDPKNPTEEEAAANRHFCRDRMKGKFTLRPLEWCENQEEAEKMQAHFETLGFINVSIERVKTIREP